MRKAVQPFPIDVWERLKTGEVVGMGLILGLIYACCYWWWGWWGFGSSYFVVGTLVYLIFMGNPDWRNPNYLAFLILYYPSLFSSRLERLIGPSKINWPNASGPLGLPQEEWKKLQEYEKLVAQFGVESPEAQRIKTEMRNCPGFEHFAISFEATDDRFKDRYEEWCKRGRPTGQRNVLG